MEELSMINNFFPVNITSYGKCGYNICKAMYNMGEEYSLFPISQIRLQSDQDQNPIIEGIESAKSYDLNATSLRLWHQHGLAESIGKGKRVGFPIFELDRFNQHELHHLRSVDELVVCSEWAKTVIENANIEISTHVAPLGVDREIFYERAEPKAGTYKILHIGKLESRKCHFDMIDIFNKAFTKDDDFHLYMMITNLGLDKKEHEQYINSWKNTEIGHKVSFLNWVETQTELSNIISSCNLSFQCSKAEGWGLPILEVMACNRPVITTDYSGMTEFCTPANSFLVNITETEPALDNRYFFGQGHWGKFGKDQVDQSCELLRKCYKEFITENQAGVTTSQEFSWQKTVRSLLKSI